MMSATEIRTGNSAGPKRIERRRNPRYPFIADVEIVDVESGMAMTGHTSDFSHGGCYVDMFSPMPKNTIVKVRLTKWQQTLETQARVVYSSVGMGMGLMFGVLDPAQRGIVESWLTRVCGARVC
jgi:PilZ domain